MLILGKGDVSLKLHVLIKMCIRFQSLLLSSFSEFSCLRINLNSLDSCSPFLHIFAYFMCYLPPSQISVQSPHLPLSLGLHWDFVLVYLFPTHFPEGLPLSVPRFLPGTPSSIFLFQPLGILILLNKCHAYQHTSCSPSPSLV